MLVVQTVSGKNLVVAKDLAILLVGLQVWTAMGGRIVTGEEILGQQPGGGDERRRRGCC